MILALLSKYGRKGEKEEGLVFWVLLFSEFQDTINHEFAEAIFKLYWRKINDMEAHRQRLAPKGLMCQYSLKESLSSSKAC